MKGKHTLFQSPYSTQTEQYYLFKYNDLFWRYLLFYTPYLSV